MKRILNWKLILLRSLGPVAVLSIGLLLGGLAARFAGQNLLDWTFAVSVGLLIVGFMLTFWQLRRWERGRVDCPKCGGPLGWWVHLGRRCCGRKLPDFRRCWNCGKARPEE